MNQTRRIPALPLLWRVICCGLLLAGCNNDRENFTEQPAKTTQSGRLQADSRGNDEYTSTHLQMIAGNRVELLVDGPETYDAMFAAIESATDHVNLETFILADDEIGRHLAATLIERVANGIVVNLVYDALGSVSTDEAFFERMRAGGINLLAFHPPLETLPGDWHNRNHRKVLVVDGRTGFTGGLNFSNEYLFSSRSNVAKAQTDKSWRDTHVEIRGPAVAALQRAFVKLWTDSGDERPLPPADYFPELSVAGDHAVGIVAVSGDDEFGSSIVDVFIEAASRATSRIWLTQAYFAPADEIVHALQAAAKRGVDVRILLPGESDVELAELAADAHYSDLLRTGVRIFEYQAGILHAKSALIDDTWSTVGSSNLDLLSMEFNNELNAVIVDDDFTADLADTFITDIQHAREITVAEWDDRSWWTKLKHTFANLLQGGN